MRRKYQSRYRGIFSMREILAKFAVLAIINLVCIAVGLASDL